MSEDNNLHGFNGMTSVLNIQSSYGFGIQFTKTPRKSVTRDLSPDRLLWYWHNMLVGIQEKQNSRLQNATVS